MKLEAKGGDQKLFSSNVSVPFYSLNFDDFIGLYIDISWVMVEFTPLLSALVIAKLLCF